MKLAIEYTGKTFQDVAAHIDEMIGNIKDDPVKPKTSQSDNQQILCKTYKATQKAQPGDLVYAYLATRGVDELIYPDALRFAPSLRDGEGGIRPCMVAIVSGPDGKPVTMHRTFLKPDGSAKAEMSAPRKLMPGGVPDGSCVRLCEYVSGGPLGIAEGIETAMSASALYQIPVWSAINSEILRKWTPPEGCNEVAIFGDNDPKNEAKAKREGEQRSPHAVEVIKRSIVILIKNTGRMTCAELEPYFTQMEPATLQKYLADMTSEGRLARAHRPNAKNAFEYWVQQ